MPDIEDNFLSVCGANGYMASWLCLCMRTAFRTATQAHRDEITGCLLMVDPRVYFLPMC